MLLSSQSSQFHKTLVVSLFCWYVRTWVRTPRVFCSTWVINPELCSSWSLTLTGNGYIPTSSLREILRELDEQLTEEELDGLIQEIDTDGSGTVDFDGKTYILGKPHG